MSPSENWHSGQTSPCVRPAVTASTTSYQSDSSSLRRSSRLSGMSTYPHCLSPVADSRRSLSREGASLVPLPPPDQVAPPPPAPATRGEGLKAFHAKRGRLESAEVWRCRLGRTRRHEQEGSSALQTLSCF